MDERGAATMKAAARETWAAGNFDEVAEKIWDVGERLVSRIGAAEGERVLDIGAGTGNAALPAAAAGCAVVASDLTPELFEAGRRRAAEAGVELDWVEADAEQLPFEDGAFDVVLSTFGIMFAPRHRVAAAEAARVLAPDGRIGICSWRPEGRIGEFFRTIAEKVPPPPDAEPPPLWGDPDYLGRLFAGHGISFECTEEITEFPFSSPEQAVEFYSTKFGPLVKAREALTAEGRWDELEASMVDYFAQDAREAGDGIVGRGEYLLAIGSRSGGG